MLKQATVPCPLCSTPSVEHIWSSPNASLVLFCPTCGHIFTDVAIAVQQGYEDFGQSYPTSYLLDQNNPLFLLARDRVAKLLSHHPSIRSVIEVGPAYGHFLTSLPLQISASGIEPSATEADFAEREFNLRIFRTNIEQASLYFSPTSTDAVCAFHVLEHFQNPTAFFNFTKYVLRPKGNIYVAVPDIETEHPDLIQLLFLCNGWHRHYFSRDSLAWFLAKYGYTAEFVTEQTSTMLPSSVACIASAPSLNVEPPIVNIKQQRSHGTAFTNGLGALCENLRKAFSLWREKQKKVGIFGAGLHTQSLLCFTSIDMAPIAFLVDDDEKKHGTYLNGIRILSRENAKVEQPDILLISSMAAETSLLKGLPSEFSGCACLGIYADIAKERYE